MCNLGYREIKTVLSLVTLVLCMEGSYKLHLPFVGVDNGIFAVAASTAPSHKRIIRKKNLCIVMLASKCWLGNVVYCNMICRTPIQ